MRFFERHRKDADPAPPGPVSQFWAWWLASGAQEVAAAADGAGSAERLDELLTARVHAVHPNLAWECGPAGTGGPGRWTLTLTAAGDPEARAAARRWLLAAPSRSRDWTFTDSRAAATDPASVRIQLGGWTVDVASAVAAAQVKGGAVDLSVYHPVFQDVDEGSAEHLAYLLLDTVLGERDVELWVGAVDVTAEPPLDPVPLTGLRAVVGELRSRATGPDGEPAWALLRGQTPEGAPVVAMARQPLRSASAPQLDTYVGVFVAYTDATDEGLPGPAALVELRDIEDRLTGLGPRGAVLAHQTSSGMRVLHVYVDSTSDGEQFVRSVARQWRGNATVQAVQAQLDPAWAAVGHLRG